MTEPQKPHRMTHRNAVTGEIISVTEYPENAPILPALTANERGEDLGWPDEKVQGLAAYLLPVLREQAEETRTKVGHLMAPNEVPTQHAAADLIEHLLAERAQHAAEIAAAVQALTKIADMPIKHGSCLDNQMREIARNAIRARGTTEALDRTKAGVISEIAAERRRQIEVEGWTPEHDNEHGQNDLLRAAIAYGWAQADAGSGFQASYAQHVVWPWEPVWWKPKDRRSDLIRAAALLVAEIERMDRLPTPSSAEGKR